MQDIIQNLNRKSGKNCKNGHIIFWATFVQYSQHSTTWCWAPTAEGEWSCSVATASSCLLHGRDYPQPSVLDQRERKISLKKKKKRKTLTTMTLWGLCNCHFKKWNKKTLILCFNRATTAHSISAIIKM